MLDNKKSILGSDNMMLLKWTSSPMNYPPLGFLLLPSGLVSSLVSPLLWEMNIHFSTAWAPVRAKSYFHLLSDSCTSGFWCYKISWRILLSYNCTKIQKRMPCKVKCFQLHYFYRHLVVEQPVFHSWVDESYFSRGFSFLMLVPLVHLSGLDPASRLNKFVLT